MNDIRPTEKGQAIGLAVERWLGVKDLKAGYYWCRLSANDDQPTIVKICDQTSEEELALWEFERGEWEPLTSYDHAWQFLQIASPNVPDQPRE